MELSGLTYSGWLTTNSAFGLDVIRSADGVTYP